MPKDMWIFWDICNVSTRRICGGVYESRASFLSTMTNVVARTGCSTEVIAAFAALVRPEIQDERIDLLRAALTFARCEYPQIDIDHYVHKLEELALRVAARIAETGDPAQTIAALNKVLFDEDM